MCGINVCVRAAWLGYSVLHSGWGLVLFMTTHIHKSHSTGGGRDCRKFWTLSGKGGARWGFDPKILHRFDMMVAAASVIGLMWKGWASINQLVAALIQDKLENDNELHKLAVARLQDKAEAEAKHLRDKVEAEAGRNKLEVARLQVKTEAEAKRLRDKAEAEAERLRDKAQINYYSMRLFGSSVYEPLQKKRKKGPRRTKKVGRDSRRGDKEGCWEGRECRLGRGSHTSCRKWFVQVAYTHLDVCLGQGRERMVDRVFHHAFCTKSCNKDKCDFSRDMHIPRLESIRTQEEKST